MVHARSSACTAPVILRVLATIMPLSVVPRRRALNPLTAMHVVVAAVATQGVSFAPLAPPGPRPRILATESDFESARTAVATDPTAASYLATMEGWASDALNTSVPHSCDRKKGGNTDNIRLYAQLWKHTGNTT